MSIWIPSWSSWIKAITLPFWIFPVWTVVIYWTGGIVAIISAITQDLSFLVLACLISAILSPFLLLPFLHHLLFGKPQTYRPNWMPGRISFWEGLTALGATISSLCSTVFLIAPFATLGNLSDYQYISGDFQTYFTDYHYYDSDRFLAYAALGIWLISSAYVYHWQNLICRWLKKSERPIKP